MTPYMSEMKAHSGNHLRNGPGRRPADLRLDPSSTLFNTPRINPELKRPVAVTIFFRHKHPRPVEMHLPRRTL